jgi:hypothetical protein
LKIAYFCLIHKLELFIFLRELNMFERIKVLFIALLLSNVCSVKGQSAGFSNTFLFLSLNGGANTHYDLNAATAHLDFNNLNLGTFNPAYNSLILKGGEYNVWKCGGCDLTSTRINYRIYPTASAGGGFSQMNLPYSSGFNNGCGGQDQIWSVNSNSVNVLSGLSPGTYFFEVYSDATVTCSGGTVYASNSGSNYKATFTVLSDVISLNTIGAWVSEDFNTLANSGSSSIMPIGWSILETGTNANSSYTVGTGSSNLGDSYSFGAASATDRSLGGLFSGSLNPSFGAKILNNTSSTIVSLSISYTGETWRVGAANRADRIDFQYSLNATALNSGTWINVDSLDYENAPQITSPISGSLIHSSNKQYTITGLSIAPGSVFWIKWTDFDATGSDDGMGIDDFSIKPCFAVSTPTVSAHSICGSGNISNLSAIGTAIAWYQNNSGGSPLVSNLALANGTYYATQTLSSCESARASSLVSILPTPSVSAGSNQTICPGSQVTLTGSGATSYVWNNGVTNGVLFTPSSSQTYTVTGTASNGCTNTAQVTVSLSPEVSWANLQWPASGTINCGSSLPVYGKVYDASFTPSAGANPSITVQVGVHTANTDPSTWPAGVWSTANYNAQVVNDDEYIANIGSNLAQGTYYYSFRYALNGATCYRYGGFQGGFWNGSSNVNGVLTVNGLDWANLQFPANGSICASGNFSAYGQVFEAGITNSQGATAGLIAEIGVSGINSDPSTWASNAWTAASFNAQSGNNDEFVGTLSGLSAGTYYYAWRYKLANSCNYQYGGYNASGGGFWNGSSNVNGVLTVYANPVANAGLDITDASTCGKDNVTLSAAALSAGQSGAWTLSSGTNNNVFFNNPASSTSTFTGSYGGTYVLQWAVSSNGCTGTDQMTVTFNQPTDATISALVGTGDLLWCGLTNTDWSTVTNWYQKQAAGHYVRMSNSVPSLGNEVFTVSTANAGICVGNNTPSLSVNGNAEDLYVGVGVTLNLSNDSMNIAHNLINQGTIVASTGTVNFTGSTNSIISGASNTQLYNMRVNKSTGATLTLQQPVLVTNTLTMNQGNVFTTSANLLTLGTSSATPGGLTYNSGSIVGPFKRYFANVASAGTAGLFPVGTAVYNRYADFNFGSGPGVDQFLTVEYMTGAPLQGGVPLYNGLPLTASGSLIQNYSADGYWSVIPTNNDYTAPITGVPYNLSLFANNLTGMQSPQICRIIKSAGSNNAGQHHAAWQACGTHTPINGAANPQSFLITSTGSQGFSWFSIGTPNSQALPVELLSFNGDCNEGQVSLSWQTATEHNSDFFEVEKSRDGMHWQVLTTVNAAGKSTQLLNYDAMDAYAMEVNNYYRLTQVDIDGSKEIFNVINIRCDRRLHSYISAYPNPSTGSFQVILNDKQLVGSGILSVKDTKGTELLNRTIEVKPGINMFSVTDLNLAPGVYYIQFVNGAHVTEVLKEVIR